MTKSVKYSISLLAILLSGLVNNVAGQKVNITVLQAQYTYDGVFTGYPVTGFFKVIWKKDQQNVALEPNTVLLKVILAPEAGYNLADNIVLPADWKVQGTPTVNGITLVNSAPFSTEEELTVEIPVKTIAPRSTTMPLVGAYIQNAGGDWTNISAGWEASTSVTVADKPLPVVLASINAKAQEDAINVSWKTTQEVRFDHFELQKSLNPKNGFTTLAKIASQRETKGYSYNYLDKNVEPGIPIYYRLKMIDNDGSFAFSRIVSAKTGSEMSTNIYPNPASDLIEINALKEITQVQIIDLNGVMVMNRKFDGSNKKETVSIDKLNNGTYLVKIITWEGKIQIRKVVVIH